MELGEFDKKGFLGSEAQIFANELIEKHKAWFELCDELNELAQKTKYEFQIDKQNEQETLVACLFIRIINDFQSIVILAKYGLPPQVKVILRSLIETSFLLKVCPEDFNFVSEYIKSSKKESLKLSKLSKRVVASPQKIQEIDKSLKEFKNVKRMNIEDLAEKAERQSHYIIYRNLSETVHVSTASLQDEYLVLDDNGELKSFNWGPTDRDLELLLSTACEGLFFSLQSVCKLFRIDKKEQLNSIAAKPILK